MDAYDGHFGGEIRLGYLYDGKSVTLVTGGSVNGNIFTCQYDLVFSLERYSDSCYSGPFAVRIKDVAVAGR
jgi:hypothetical protein